jgi:Transposase IS116/IS110/IS902 family
VSGVGPLIALTFLLTVEDKERFAKSRDVGCFIGLRPRRQDSGERRPQLPITKEGDMYLRALLVQGAHCILSRQGPDTDLKRWGERMRFISRERLLTQQRESDLDHQLHARTRFESRLLSLTTSDVSPFSVH